MDQGTQLIDRSTPTVGKLVAKTQARILAPMLRGSALVALAALLLSPPIVAAYSIWPAALALFWFAWVTLSWWLCERGHTRAAAAAFVALTWLTFTIPGVLSVERFSEGNAVASLVIAALLLPWQGVAAVGMCSLAVAGAAVALDTTAYALPLLFPKSNYLRLAATLLEMSLVFIALCLTTREMRRFVRIGIDEALARGGAAQAWFDGDQKIRALQAQTEGKPLPVDARFTGDRAVAVRSVQSDRDNQLQKENRK